MANLKERRQLIGADELQNDLLKAISYLAQDLDAVAQRVTTDETIQTKVEDELRIARNRFAEHLKTIAGTQVTRAPRKVAARRRKNSKARKSARQRSGRIRPGYCRGEHRSPGRSAVAVRPTCCRSSRPSRFTAASSS